MAAEFRLDAHRVAGRLIQGSFPAAGPFVARYAQVLVLCAKELQPHPAAYPGVVVVHAPMSDDGSPMTELEGKIARRAAGRVRRYLDQGKTCLVTCHMGLNRSGLVSALTLMLPPTNGGMVVDTPSCLTSDQAIRLVRGARGPSALGNEYFVHALSKADGICGPRTSSFRAGFYLP